MRPNHRHFVVRPKTKHQVPDAFLAAWPIDRPPHVDQRQSEQELEAIRHSLKRATPLGSEDWTPAIELTNARKAFDVVLAKAGCWPRDRVTKRTVNEVTSKSGSWGRNAPLEPTDEWFLDGLTPTKALADSDGDGLPDAWEKSHDLNPNDPSDAARIVAAGESIGDRHQGYPYMEFYINELADNLSP